MFSSIKFANIRRDRPRFRPNKSIYQKIEHGSDRYRRDNKYIFARHVEREIEINQFRIEMKHYRVLIETLVTKITDQEAKIDQLQSQIKQFTNERIGEYSIVTESSAVANEPEQQQQDTQPESLIDHVKSICAICDQELVDELERKHHMETIHTAK